MEADEIRATLLEARRACAEVQARQPDGRLDMGIIQLTEILSQLADVTESLLNERETFADRLRRTRAVRAPEAPPVEAPPPQVDAPPH
jgi:hypothetical protein